jgi:hypothetical protein
VLLVAVVACVRMSRADPIVGKWNELVTDAMTQKKIGANMVRGVCWVGWRFGRWVVLGWVGAQRLACHHVGRDRFWSSVVGHLPT